jgi:hypothetical protein
MLERGTLVVAQKPNVMIAACLAVLVFWSPGLAQACLAMQGVDLGYLANAQVVLRAKVQSYVLRTDNLPRAEFTFEVLEAIHGSPVFHKLPTVPKLRANWVNSTFGMPVQWTGPTSVIVGLQAKILGDGSPVVEVLQQPCASGFIIADTPENVRAVKDAIKARRRNGKAYNMENGWPWWQDAIAEQR